MANNRMWLANKRTGKKILIAKYYPFTGWESEIDTEDCMDKFFEDIDSSLGKSQWGNTDFELEFEQEGDL